MSSNAKNIAASFFKTYQEASARRKRALDLLKVIQASINAELQTLKVDEYRSLYSCIDSGCDFSTQGKEYLMYSAYLGGFSSTIKHQVADGGRPKIQFKVLSNGYIQALHAGYGFITWKKLKALGLIKFDQDYYAISTVLDPDNEGTLKAGLDFFYAFLTDLGSSFGVPDYTEEEDN